MNRKIQKSIGKLITYELIVLYRPLEKVTNIFDNLKTIIIFLEWIKTLVKENG